MSISIWNDDFHSDSQSEGTRKIVFQQPLKQCNLPSSGRRISAPQSILIAYERSLSMAFALVLFFGSQQINPGNVITETPCGKDQLIA